MKTHLLWLTISTLLWSSVGLSAGKQYDLRVDGLACAFCAYGIEKKFTKTDGVESVEVNLKKGLVIVTTNEDKTFSKEELTNLINNAGFTLKSMREEAVP